MDEVLSELPVDRRCPKTVLTLDWCGVGVGSGVGCKGVGVRATNQILLRLAIAFCRFAVDNSQSHLLSGTRLYRLVESMVFMQKVG